MTSAPSSVAPKVFAQRLSTALESSFLDKCSEISGQPKLLKPEHGLAFGPLAGRDWKSFGTLAEALEVAKDDPARTPAYGDLQAKLVWERRPGTFDEEQTG